MTRCGERELGKEQGAKSKEQPGKQQEGRGSRSRLKPRSSAGGRRVANLPRLARRSRRRSQQATRWKRELAGSGREEEEDRCGGR
eukprot:400294-Hanusia_phi.AAC.2